MKCYVTSLEKNQNRLEGTFNREFEALLGEDSQGIYRQLLEKGLDPFCIIDMIKMGYNSKDIHMLMRSSDARCLANTIVKYHIKKANKPKEHIRTLSDYKK